MGYQSKQIPRKTKNFFENSLYENNWKFLMSFAPLFDYI